MLAQCTEDMIDCQFVFLVDIPLGVGSGHAFLVRAPYRFQNSGSEGHFSRLSLLVALFGRLKQSNYTDMLMSRISQGNYSS